MILILFSVTIWYLTVLTERRRLFCCNIVASVACCCNSLALTFHRSRSVCSSAIFWRILTSTAYCDLCTSFSTWLRIKSSKACKKCKHIFFSITCTSNSALLTTEINAATEDFFGTEFTGTIRKSEGARGAKLPNNDSQAVFLALNAVFLARVFILVRRWYTNFFDSPRCY